MASKGPRCKLDHETRAKRQKVGLFNILFVDYLLLFFFLGYAINQLPYLWHYDFIFSAMILFCYISGANNNKSCNVFLA